MRSAVNSPDTGVRGAGSLMGMPPLGNEMSHDFGDQARCGRMSETVAHSVPLVEDEVKHEMGLRCVADLTPCPLPSREGGARRDMMRRWRLQWPEQWPEILPRFLSR